MHSIVKVFVGAYQMKCDFFKIYSFVVVFGIVNKLTVCMQTLLASINLRVMASVK